MRRILVSAIAVSLAGLSMGALAQAAAPTAPLATTQLPRSVRPTHYDVAVVPHADSLRFDGKVAIAIEVLEATSRITLNALDMRFNTVQLTPASGKARFAAPQVAVDAKAQTATFTFAQPVPAGRYTLAIDYSGKIATQANGLFAIDYDTQAGKKRALFSQFEAPDARRFIPSWDEPAYKATFTLQATVPSAQMAVSNMPVAERKDLGNGMARVRFAPTPRMSTYLLFFGTGDFDRITTKSGATEVGVVTQKGSVEQARFAMDSSADVLREYNDYFGVDYPLPKLDNVASPGSSQFFGAMENWGAILTFEHTLLLNPSISTPSDRQRVFGVAAHEIAHQWFGNLVTMQWWDDLWLNEGFATWMAGRTTEKLHPEWNTALSAVFSRDGAMGLDAVASTHPVVQRVQTVEQVSQAFDAITYQKGAAVIRMIEGYVGADAWRTGVRSYMRKHAYGNTVSDDLWREIQAAAGKPVLDIAHDFTLQPGVPLIRVAQGACVDDTTTLTLVQDEFTKDRAEKKALAWRVPVIASVLGSGTGARTVVDGGKGTLQVSGCGPVVVNAGQTGYYRTLYAPAQFANVRDAFARLGAVDQLGLLQDAWALGMTGRQPASDYLDLAAATTPDADPQIWAEIAGAFSSLDSYYGDDAARRATFRRFAIARLSPVFAQVGWRAQAGEADPVKILRDQLIGTLGVLGDPAVIAEARRRYAAQASDADAIPTDLRRTILGVVAHNADAATWDQLHAAAVAEKTALVKDMLYSLLSVAKDEALAKRALELALTDEPGATNSASMIRTVASFHPDLAFDFAVAHRAEVDRKVDASALSRYYPGLASNSLDPAMVARIKAYADANLAEGSRRPADTAIANILYRTQVRRERLPAIDAWLAAHGG